MEGKYVSFVMRVAVKYGNNRKEKARDGKKWLKKELPYQIPSGTSRTLFPTISLFAAAPIGDEVI